MIDHASEMAAFVRVVDLKGFSAAAPSLGLTPSAVSKLVTRLETRLGVRLLQRTTRALHLTEDGEVFYAAAQRIVAEIETLENQIAGQSGNPHGVLRVTTSLAFSSHQLAPVLPEFLARHPLIELDLLPTDRVIDMVEEGMDGAIRIGLVSRLSVVRGIRVGGLVRLLDDYSADEPVGIHAVYPHRRHLAPKVPAFVNFLIEKFTPPPWEI